MRIIFLIMLLVISSCSKPEHAKIVAFGDSLVAGYGLQLNESFPSVLESMLKTDGYDVTVLNYGISGETTSQAKNRIDSVINENLDAKIFIIVLGGNDIKRPDPDGNYIKDMRANLSYILTQIKAKNMKILLCGMKSPPQLGGLNDNAKLSDLYEYLSNDFDTELYPFFLDKTFGVRGNSLDDMIHPNAAGVVEITKDVIPLVKDLL